MNGHEDDAPNTGAALATLEEEPGTGVATEEQADEWRAEREAAASAEDADAGEVDATAICIEVAQRLEKQGDPDANLDWVEGEKFQDAATPQEIGVELIDRLPVFDDLRTKQIDYLYRPKDWSAGGQMVEGWMKSVSGLLSVYAGKDFIAMFSHETWKLLSSWQKVALVYHELRHGIGPHQFEGYFDEIEVFGTQTYVEWERLRESVARGGRKAEQLDLGLADMAPNDL